MAQPSPKRLRLDSAMSRRPETGVATAGPDSKPEPSNPFMPMFEEFRAALDTHHDRRERIIKASRDVTANSKKM